MSERKRNQTSRRLASSLAKWRDQQSAVINLAREAEERYGLHRRLTLREVAVKTTVTRVEDMVEASDDLELIVAIRYGSGIAAFERKGDYQIEFVGRRHDGTPA